MRTLVLRLATLALLANVLVPAGFMLHPTGGAGLTVVLCPDQGAMPGYTLDEHHPTDAAEEFSASSVLSDEGTCGFSLLAAPLLARVAPVLLPQDLVAVVVPTVRVAILPAIRRSQIPVRGPPVFS